MITRIFNVIDEGTSMYFIVTMFELVDQAICSQMGISPGFKIVNRMRGRVVDTFAGYKFNPDYAFESIEAQSRKYDIDGTSSVFSLLLGETENIQRLPDTIDVEQLREFWIMSSRTIFIRDSILESIEEHSPLSLRKCLYSTTSSIHIALIDTEKDEVVNDIGVSGDLRTAMPQYLWIPVKEGDVEYIKKVNVCWFMDKLIKPDA